MGIAENIADIRNRIEIAAKRAGRAPEEITLLAVTKTYGPEPINRAIDSGITAIGENKVQEILDKYDIIKPVSWHMIGHLQTNKVKYIIDKVDLIHSVDSLRLAEEISRRATALGKAADILIQINGAGEENKFGVSEEQAEPLLSDILEHCPGVRVKGVMGVVPFVDNPEDVRAVFRKIKGIYDGLSTITHPQFEPCHLSMGMSGDFEVAIEEGSTIVRVGTSIFGQRIYI